MQRKTVDSIYLSRALPGSMIPKSGRVLERNPITMEYYRGIASSQRPAKRGRVMRPRNIRTLCGMGRSVKSIYKQEL